MRAASSAWTESGNIDLRRRAPLTVQRPPSRATIPRSINIPTSSSTKNGFPSERSTSSSWSALRHVGREQPVDQRARTHWSESGSSSLNARAERSCPNRAGVRLQLRSRRRDHEQRTLDVLAAPTRAGRAGAARPSADPPPARPSAAPRRARSGTRPRCPGSARGQPADAGPPATSSPRREGEEAAARRAARGSSPASRFRAGRSCSVRISASGQ